MAYEKIKWVNKESEDFIEGQVPSIDASQLGHIEDGVVDAHQKIQETNDMIKRHTIGVQTGTGSYVYSFPAEGGTTTLEIDMGDIGNEIDRVTVYINSVPPIVLYLNRGSDALQKGHRTVYNNYNVPEITWGTSDAFRLRMAYDSYQNQLKNGKGATWIKSPKIEDNKIIIPFEYSPSEQAAYEMTVNFCWENG